MWSTDDALPTLECCLLAISSLLIPYGRRPTRVFCKDAADGLEFFDPAYIPVHVGAPTCRLLSLSLGETYPEKRGNFFKQNQHDSLPPSTAMVEKIDAVDYHTHDAEPGSDSDDNND